MVGVDRDERFVCGGLVGVDRCERFVCGRCRQM